ncbi:DUF1801 domain-containing protein [Synechococcus sp. BA-124 BA4]|jgi:hypothetical protein|uniref:DUF1801 domain-containing protein n=1 Tax=Synechococcus sp. BA-124 BA4 TaxID=3110251 RepID=UPI002B1FD82E|nr:DUF1801 domain-containing protein [Synechococcus sp. BA-124 BA4]MEA5400936.1 DUF1801 domain-containing protein [Synechococcus sp. BA-124 BA4]
MHTITSMGIFEDVVKRAPKEVCDICLALRSLIAGLHPDAVEVPRPGEPSAAYGYGEKKMSEAYAYIMPQKTYANLGFYHGASIASTDSLLEGTGKTLRHIKVRSVVMAQSDAIKAVLLAAMDERRTALGL